MGKKKSKGELLYEQVSYNEFQKQVSYDNSESIRALHRQGADLESKSLHRQTPLGVPYRKQYCSLVNLRACATGGDPESLAVVDGLDPCVTCPNLSGPGCFCVSYGGKKWVISTEAKKKKILSTAILSTHHRDWSPSDPPEDLDITSLLEAEAQLYADEAQSSFDMAEPVQYQPQPEADDGIPTTCYCGGEPIVATAYTEKDPGRRYFTCDNVDDGDCHIWKWWDVAVMDEMRDFQTQLRRLKEEGTESEQKLLLLEKTIYELGKENSQVKLMVCLLVLIGLVFLVLRGVASKASNGSVLSPHEWLYKQVLEVDREEEDVGEPEARPIGVKAAKAGSKKKKSGREEELSKLHGVLELKEKLSRHKVLDRLLAKKEPLSEMETSLKLKLMSEMLMSRCRGRRGVVKVFWSLAKVKLSRVHLEM
ncbi:hypothetical protein F2Q68_00014068 [Brassica cretica]|uniref:GRF-type domain-containing protein n=1 Tax=Brassica cretica TaxID=69181 RepID=A0A8S9HPP8_BRACR|nr:hypothetical protein F2Q68_00014068 [Brassica cretica]